MYSLHVDDHQRSLVPVELDGDDLFTVRVRAHEGEGVLGVASASEIETVLGIEPPEVEGFEAVRWIYDVRQESRNISNHHLRNIKAILTVSDHRGSLVVLAILGLVVDDRGARVVVEDWKS